MKYPIVVCTLIIVIVVVVFTTNCDGSKHAYGDRNAKSFVKLCGKKLIDDSDNNVPKDYTIIFKFFGTIFQPILYIEIDVNKESTGDMIESMGVQDRLYSSNGYSDYDATIHIKNATHVTADLAVYTFDLPQSGIGLWRESITYVYVKNTTRTEKSHAQNSIGKRIKGDKLIYFESRNVTNSKALEYSGNEYLTYVGFSFNSPTAMALVNTTFVKPKEFSAIVYDMNTEHFVANISVYGLNLTDMPRNTLGLISTP